MGHQDSANLLRNLQERLRRFAEARDWDQFHSPKNLSMAMIVEAAELVEHFQWLTEDQSTNLTGDKLVSESRFLYFSIAEIPFGCA